MPSKRGVPTVLEAFEFLDELRESGATNMWGARPYLTRRFHMSDEDRAGALTVAWLRTFDGETSLEERVEKAGEI